MPSPRNLVNLKAVEKGYGSRSVLQDVTLGVAAGERIGVVGGNGGGKSTLLRADRGRRAAGRGHADAHAASWAIALLDQRDELDGTPRSARRSSASAPSTSGPATALFAACSTGCLGGVRLERFSAGMDTPIAGLSGGERRRVALARLLLDAARAAAARRAHQPPGRGRRRTGWRATWPRAAARCSWSPTTAGSWTRCAPRPGRWPTAPSTSTRAATRPTCWRAPSATARRPRARIAAASCCARSSRGCDAGRRRARPSRSSGSRRPTR